MASIKETLVAARKVIEHPKNWTTGTLARDAKGNEAPVRSDRAICFCAMGALERVGEHLMGPAYDVLFDTAQDDGFNVSSFNDNHTHEEVLALFDRAIANAN